MSGYKKIASCPFPTTLASVVGYLQLRSYETILQETLSFQHYYLRAIGNFSLKCQASKARDEETPFTNCVENRNLVAGGAAQGAQNNDSDVILALALALDFETKMTTARTEDDDN
ncbi:hypothetical protein KEM54_005882 [Ascosphaera aggregata]|nr:hypothetical protein KEM54_005882 [Ascosphaera aggregata]